MSESRKQLIEEFLLSYRTTGQLLLKLLQAVFENQAPAHYSGLLLLKVLKAHGPISQKVIAQHLCHSEAAISRQVALAQEKGLIQVDEDPDNRRTSIISLTAQGETVVEAISEKALSYLAGILQNLSDEEMRAVIAVNQRMQSMLATQTHKETHVD